MGIGGRLAAGFVAVAALVVVAAFGMASASPDLSSATLVHVIEHANTDAVSDVLGLPRHVRPVGLIAIGHCAQPPDRAPRRSRPEIVHRDRYGDG